MCSFTILCLPSSGSLKHFCVQKGRRMFEICGQGAEHHPVKGRRVVGLAVNSEYQGRVSQERRKGGWKEEMKGM